MLIKVFWCQNHDNLVFHGHFPCFPCSLELNRPYFVAVPFSLLYK